MSLAGPSDAVVYPSDDCCLVIALAPEDCTRLTVVIYFGNRTLSVVGKQLLNNLPPEHKHPDLSCSQFRRSLKIFFQFMKRDFSSL